MSGGFFRGTSADQDTRFSNKQAKLLKSQKFAPELDHLVDMTKVKIDTIKPWIATRVTEFLGFEDEVLINFIYGLLDRKDVNGKEVQIQLTGFMEKNTGKFMKELWTLLLSAQKNASGIPQQILDATDEELRKKKAEADRITQEIQKRKEKEGRELELENLKKMDGGNDDLRANNAESDLILRRSRAIGSSVEKEADKRNGSTKMNTDRASKSPHTVDHSPCNRSSPSRSVSKSFSHSRSYSDERHRSRSISGSPQPRGRNISPERRYRSPRRRSVSPHHWHSPRRTRSPLRRRSHHSRHRSSSYSQRRSLSPVRRRLPSPSRRRPPSPVRHRSPSPVRRQLRRSPSPPRRRSPPPVHRRSPLSFRRKSPTPSQRRSPRWNSPSPVRRRSPSPVRRRSPPPRSPRHRRRSPLRSPRLRFRSRSPYRSRSPAYRSHRSLSRDHDARINGVESRSARDDYVSQRTRGKMSPVRHALDREVERLGQARRGLDAESCQPPISLRSPQRDPRNQSNANLKGPASAHTPEFSRSPSETSLPREKLSPHDDRARSPSESPLRQGKERVSHHGSASPVRQPKMLTARHDKSETSWVKEISHARDDDNYRTNSSERRIRHSPKSSNRKNSSVKDFRQEDCSPGKVDDHQSAEARDHPDNREPKKKDWNKNSLIAPMRTGRSESPIQKESPMWEGIEYGPGRLDGGSFVPDDVQNGRQPANKHRRDSPSLSGRVQKSSSREGNKADEGKHSHSSKAEDRDRRDKTEVVRKSMKKVDRKNRPGDSDSDSDSDEKEKFRSDHMEKRKHKRSSRHDIASDDSAHDDSEIEERKEAKRRRKEEKRLRKEERRRRHEERHRRREERRASKLKVKSVDTVTPPSDFVKLRNDADDSECEVDARKESSPSDTEETESEQKKLEIELRKKALESLRAKKGINN